MIRKTKPFARTLTTLSALFLWAIAGPATSAGFASPSGNIRCYIDIYSDARFDEMNMICLVGDAEWELPPDYGDDDPTCDLDRTRTVILPPNGPARARWTCHGDVFWPAPLGAISYGSQWSLGAFTCQMETSGVTCQSDAGRSFTVARRTLDLN